MPSPNLIAQDRTGIHTTGLHLSSPRQTRKNSLLSRCRAIESGASDVMFDPSEVREILGLVLEQVRWSAEEEINDDSDDGKADNDNDRPDEEFAIEERTWSAGESAERDEPGP